MTAAMNATLNLSNMDGWVMEFGKNMENSFIMDHSMEQDLNEQDNQDAYFLYKKLEEEVTNLMLDEDVDNKKGIYSFDYAESSVKMIFFACIRLS